MSTKLKRMDRGGYHWLVAVARGKSHWLYRMARLGERHCMAGSSRVTKQRLLADAAERKV